MSEKRDIKRNRKRLKVRFGIDAPTRVAFTEDLTDLGLFVLTSQPEKPGSLLLIELYLPDDKTVLAQGRVRWAKKVPPQLMRVAHKGGMGVRLLHFESGEGAYHQFIAQQRH